MKKLAELWIPTKEVQNQVRCLVCAHYCTINSGKRGFCRTRENLEGKLYTLIYGSCISHGSNDPIEKKPLNHFWPGSNAFSIATIGCSFHCQFCQNWEISQSFPDEEGKSAQFSQKDQKEFGLRNFPLVNMTAEEVVQRALEVGAESIAYTYNEPTIWYEFVKDTALLAHQKNIKNILVTNGYSSPEVNAEFVKFIDAANVDVKAFNDAFYQRLIGVPSLDPVLRTCEYFVQHGVHVELTNLLIPNENDNALDIQHMAEWIRDSLGPFVPLHFSAYHPMYRMDHPQTPSQLLLQAQKIAQDVGLNYVFLGNIASDTGSDTYCPQCHALIIERRGYRVQNKNLDPQNRCKKCGCDLHIQGNFVGRAHFDFF